MSSAANELRAYLESNLFEFAKYINPHYAYGDVHRRVFEWLTGKDANDHQLLLLPRAHLKSHCIAVWAVWQITREPWTTMVYLSAGEDLATNQVYAIKNMMTCDRYRLLWPEMIKENEGERSKWSAWAFNVDHPERERRGVRDNTIIVKTVKSNAIGLHCSHLVLDDVVVPRFAYTATGRKEVQQSVSQFASIKNPGAVTKAVGTRYHPADLYNDFANAERKLFDKDGMFTGTAPLWDIFEAKVEDSPNQDMTGLYLWPRTMHPETREWHGFDIQILASILAQYESTGEREQFFAQYYNDPNDPDSYRLDRSNFHYYDKKYLRQQGDNWYFKERKLNIFCGMDIAGTGWAEKGGKAADYTAIAVLGVDVDGTFYVLDLDQFKTSDFNEYYKRVFDLQMYWGFRKITIETNSIGKQVKQAIENLAYENGVRMVVEGVSKNWTSGSKQERHAAILEPRYKQNKVLHYKGGYVPELEEQIILARPRHDDLEDALCIAMEAARPPSKSHVPLSQAGNKGIVYHPRFGGRRRH
jgi:hypothetical protein